MSEQRTYPFHERLEMFQSLVRTPSITYEKEAEEA